MFNLLPKDTVFFDLFEGLARHAVSSAEHLRQMARNYPDIGQHLQKIRDDTAATAREILAKVPTPDNAVLLAVSPNERAIEVVYGGDVQGRGIEESAPLGVSAAAASFKEGNLMDGLISAVRVLSAGVSPP